MSQRTNAMKVAIILILILAFSCFLPSLVIAQSDETNIKIQTANSSVNDAFNAVLGAEQAGANVTALLSQLNLAANNLAQAENANRIGDLNAASAKADNALSIAKLVISQAQNAEQAALASSQNDFHSAIVSILLESIILIAALIAVWLWIKKRNIIKTKSEVLINGTPRV